VQFWLAWCILHRSGLAAIHPSPKEHHPDMPHTHDAPFSPGQPPAPLPPSHPTRTLILDAAEALFSEKGFDGTTFREVAKQAGVQLSVTTYHFASKQALFEDVIGRRAAALGERRAQAMQALRGRRNWRAEDLIQTIVGPLLAFSTSGDPGWKAYGRLIAMIGSDNRWLDLVERHFNQTPQLFIEVFLERYPGVPRVKAARGYSFLVGLMLAVFTQSRRIDRLSDNAYSGEDLAASVADLVPFVAAGLRALAAQRGERPSAAEEAPSAGQGRQGRALSPAGSRPLASSRPIPDAPSRERR
jgi:AcrR family transcriptional regulator